MIVRFLGCEALLRLLMADAMTTRSLRYRGQGAAEVARTDDTETERELPPVSGAERSALV
ncbi:MAG: hypothetical protein QNJ67_18550 [Kiloniellales bacterium]|nr:hypothetical protein [Kiloniellales bacterium]